MPRSSLARYPWIRRAASGSPYPSGEAARLARLVQGSRVTYANLYERPMVDISIDPAQPMPPAAPRATRHRLADPHSPEALCGYPAGLPGDIVEAYIDPGSKTCASCEAEAAKAAENAKAG